MKKRWILYIAMLLFAGCQETPTSDKTIEVDFEKKEKDFSLGTIFSSAHVVPLETCDSSFFAYADKVIAYQDKFYIMDRRETLVVIFDKDGHFIQKIDQKGRGPQEYFWLEDICINPYEQTLELLDPAGKVLTYNLTGKFIREVRLPRSIRAYHQLIPLNRDSILFCSSAEEYLLSIYSRSKQQILARFIENEDKYKVGEEYLYMYKNNAYFALDLFDQVYYIKGTETILNYEWYFPSMDYDPTKKIPDYERGNHEEYQKIFWNLPYFYNKQFQNKQYLYTRVAIPKTKELVNIFHDKTNKRNYVFEKSKEGILFYVNYMDDDISINGISARDIETYQKLDILDEESRKLLQNYDENSNPYLIVYKFKK